MPIWVIVMLSLSCGPLLLMGIAVMVPDLLAVIVACLALCLLPVFAIGAAIEQLLKFAFHRREPEWHL